MRFSNDRFVRWVMVAACLIFGVVACWKLTERQFVQGVTLTACYGDVHVATSRDGKLMASKDYAGDIRMHDLTTNKVIATFETCAESGRMIALSPDGKTLASCCWLGDVELWDLSSRQVRTLGGKTDRIDAVSFSPDGQLLASVSRTGTVKLWEVATSRERKTPHINFANAAAVAFGPDGNTLAVGGKTIQLWDPATGKARTTLRGYDTSVTSLRFSPDGKYLASTLASPEGGAKLWDVAACKELPFDQPEWRDGIAIGDVAITALEFSPDSKTIALTTGDVAGLWDVATGKNTVAFGWGYRPLDLSIGSALYSSCAVSRRRLSLESVAFTPDSQLLICGTEGGDGPPESSRLKLWKMHVPRK
jgi:WD40 repeat protein